MKISLKSQKMAEKLGRIIESDFLYCNCNSTFNYVEKREKCTFFCVKIVIIIVCNVYTFWIYEN